MPHARSKQAPGRSVKEQAQDDLVMSTNSSSIVSKRSVERIYYPGEPHFFRFFVKKFQRRSPLINRGYHLRLHVIDVAVRNFLKRPSDKTKVVVNLGAGFDVLPWQCLTRYPAHCKGAKFIDVDFPDLMAKKCNIVHETPELGSVLTGITKSEDALIMLQSDQYVQMGCDLRELDPIEQSLSKVVDIHNAEFMFVAEVSITYMETEGADAVIKWAGSLGHAEFCLLEQILPDGEGHPFAETMLRHFDKLKTPLKSVMAYPTLQAQKDRFARLGWPHVHAETLWGSWSSDKYLSSEDRRKLNEIEPFDEWEEFAVFGGHYCVVSATVGFNPKRAENDENFDSALGFESFPSLETFTDFNDYGKTCQRRFGASMMVESDLGDTYLTNTFGLGNTSRLRSFDIYSVGTSLRDIKIGSAGPPSRMCHTVVELGTHGSLLFGGRGSPSSPLQDCWVFDKARRYWQRVQDLPVPLYRHAATRLGNSNLVLVVGGKTGSSSVFRGCLVYHSGSGWVECKTEGLDYTPVFGAMLVSLKSSPAVVEIDKPSTSVNFHGILAGGLLEDGTLAEQTLRWNLELPENGKPTIRFIPFSVSSTEGISDSRALLNRFGASAVLDESENLLVLGGVIESHVLSRQHEILLVDTKGSEVHVLAAGSIVQSQELLSEQIPRPLLVGISVYQTTDGKLFIAGGGATCFSMGTFWNKGIYTLSYNLPSLKLVTPPPRTGSKWEFNQTLEVTDGNQTQFAANSEKQSHKPLPVAIPRVQADSAATFAQILHTGKPVIIEKADLGACVQTWTPDHLTARVGHDRMVVVHEATTAKMDFNTKNFNYVAKEFGTFMKEVGGGGKMYLRALSEDGPAEKPAILNEDFPELADEFHLPGELSFVADNAFSSVLRISGPVNMWLHYDVMANVYCQIVGSKRLILFPPMDVTQLSVSPGASSSSLDVFAELETSSLANTHPHEAVLGPGDVLFLPPLWLHTAAPLTNFGVAVNVFFRNLGGGYANGRDVYGNRDLAAYEKGRQDVTRIMNSFGKVPADMKEFYVRRLADELLQKLHD